MSEALYNEIEPFAADWTENLARAGHVAAGKVDRRSIVELKPADVAGFVQCHFFAGIGGWSRALRLAGWPDDVPVWTGSCPCQPFSSAGRRGGFDDERHLWPAWFGLIRERRPSIIFGEQVASGDGLQWLDSVYSDLEGAGYTVGASDLCSAGVGAPHIRQRLYFVAFARGHERDAWWSRGEIQRLAVGRIAPLELARRGDAHGLAYHDEDRRGLVGAARLHVEGAHGDNAARRGSALGVGDARFTGSGQHARKLYSDEAQHEVGAEDGDHAPVAARAARGVADGVFERLQRLVGDRAAPPPTFGSGALRGFWRDAEWIPCLDNKARPVEPGSFPLVDGFPARVGKLRAYGNAIVPQVAETFIRSAIAARLEVLK